MKYAEINDRGLPSQTGRWVRQYVKYAGELETTSVFYTANPAFYTNPKNWFEGTRFEIVAEKETE